jgi:glycosyltransferase involved in cell wall biosynthesis
MRITIFSPTLGGGGAEHVIVSLVNSFVLKGHKVDLLLARAIGPHLDDVLPAVNIIDFNQVHVFACLPKLVKYISHSKPTAILSIQTHANVTLLLAKKISGSKVRIIVSERSNLAMEKYHGGLKTRLILWLARLLYPSAEVIHAVSYGVASSCEKELGLQPNKIKVVYNPVFIRKISDQSNPNLDFTFSLKDQGFILGAGRLTQQKDFQTLIKAFALVRSSLNLPLVIIGEGELRPELEKLITNLSLQEFIFLPGFVKDPFWIMRQCKLFVLSSAWEGLPNVLIQAMACGVPVVSTDCPSGPAEVLENGKWGRLVPIGNIELLAQAMVNAVNEKKHPDVVMRAAHFDIQRIADEYLNLFN